MINPQRRCTSILVSPEKGNFVKIHCKWVQLISNYLRGTTLANNRQTNDRRYNVVLVRKTTGPRIVKDIVVVALVVQEHQNSAVAKY